MILLVKIERLIRLGLAEEKESWFRHYIHRNTRKLLERIDYSDLIGYMKGFYENGIDVTVGEIITLENGEKYRIVQIIDRYFSKRRVTEFIIE